MSFSLPRPLRHSKAALVALLACLPFITGCATQQTLQEYEEQIVKLREEKVQLQKEKQNLEGQVSRYEAELAGIRTSPASLSTGPAEQFPELEREGISTEMRGGDLAIIIPSSITFASGSADLSSSGKQAIQAVANVLKREYPDWVYSIEGHTDTDQPSKSKFKTNRELSVARASSVHSFLVNECQIEDSQCGIVGWGEYFQAHTNSTKDQNRRVEIIVKRARVMG